MPTDTYKLEIGTRCSYQGEWMTLESIGLHGPIFRSEEGALRCIAFPLLVADPEFTTEEAEANGGHQTASFELAGELLAAVPDQARRRAEELLGHLNEIESGYRGGDPEFALENEPRPEYDPATTTQEERIRAKTLETGWSRRKIFRLLGRKRRYGLFGLVDGNTVRLTKNRGGFEPRLEQLVNQVLDTLTTKSTVTVAEIYRLVSERLREQAEAAEPSRKQEAKAEAKSGQRTVGEAAKPGDKLPALPPRSTFYRKIEPYLRERGFRHSAKYRRSAARRPKTPYGKLEVSRPGERVLIDVSPWDVFARDPITGEWLRLELMLALDAYTRSILAARFTPKSAGGIDASLILADILWPKPMLPGFPEQAAWSYVGVPKELALLCAGISDGGWRPAGVPFLSPEAVSVDHGKIFVSETFQQACQHLRISIAFRRRGRPTDGAQIERAFRTIREGLLVSLPGYKGPDVHARGDKVEADAFLFVDELEALFWEWVATVYQKRHHDGLHLPGRPGLNLSPNDMYEEGVARWGFIQIPANPNLYYELLETRWVRTINHYGIELDGLRYDGDAIHPYHGERSPFNGSRPGRWPIKLDPRDRSRVYFKGPDAEEWGELRWTGMPDEPVAFSEAVLRHAKKLVTASGGNTSNHEQLTEVLHDLLRRFRSDAVSDRREQMLALQQNLRDHQLDLDRDKLDKVVEEPPEGKDSPASGFDFDALDPNSVRPLDFGTSTDSDGEHWENPNAA